MRHSDFSHLEGRFHPSGKPQSFKAIAAQVAAVHVLCTNNLVILRLVDKATCLYCSSVIRTDQVEEYTDHGLTAICPKCMVDAVVPLILTKEALQMVHDVLFSPTGARIEIKLCSNCSQCVTKLAPRDVSILYCVTKNETVTPNYYCSHWTKGKRVINPGANNEK